MSNRSSVIYVSGKDERKSATKMQGHAGKHKISIVLRVNAVWPERDGYITVDGYHTEIAHLPGFHDLFIPQSLFRHVDI